MSASFTRKRIDLTITLGAGAFGDTVGDTVTLSGLRMTADLVNSIGDGLGTLQLRVFGLTQDMMNRLTSIGTYNTAFKLQNKIRLAAGDEESGLKYIFHGMVSDSWGGYEDAPNVALNVLASGGMDALLRPVDAISFKGSTDVAEIMAGFAKTMGLGFENNGVKVQLANPYFAGTALMQVRSCAQAANIWHKVELDTLVIWPKDASRVGDIPIISAANGLVGYPALNSKGMTVRTLFNASLRVGGKVQVVSSLPMATGIYLILKISHSLSSEMANGPWFTTFECAYVSR